MARSDVRVKIRAEDKTKRAFRSVNRSLKNMRRSVFSLRGALTSVIGGGGLIALTKNTIESADAIGKTADKLGLTTDALQEFRHAAKLSGVQIRTFDMAMQRFTRRAGEAAKDTGEAKAALKELGIQLFDNQGNIRSNEALLHDVADALDNTENQTDRLRLAFKLFDSEGVAMVNMLRNGSAGLQKMRDDARQLGIVMNEDLIRSAEDVNDKFTTASEIISVQFKSAILELSPLLIDLAGWVKEVGISFKDWLAMRNEAKLNAQYELLEQLKGSYQELAEGMAAPGFRSDKATAVIRESMQQAENSIHEVVNEIKGLDKTVSDVSVSFDEMSGQVSVVFTHMVEETETLTQKLGEAGDGGVKAADRIAKAMKAAGDSIKNNIESSLTDVLMRATTWKDAMSSIFQEVGRQFIKTRIAAPLTQALSGTIDEFFPPKAAGGPVTAGRTYLVGEKGPELFTAGASGNITPNNQLGQAVNINFTVNAMDSRSFAQGMAENRNVIIGTIRQAFNRNGKAVAI